MYNGIDSTNAGEGPLQNNRPYVATFFVLYIVVLTFFMINIFVGYVVTTFSSEGEEQYRETVLCVLNRIRDCLWAIHCNVGGELYFGYT